MEEKKENIEKIAGQRKPAEVTFNSQLITLSEMFEFVRWVTVNDFHLDPEKGWMDWLGIDNWQVIGQGTEKDLWKKFKERNK